MFCHTLPIDEVQDTKYTYLKKIDEHELLAYFGLMYARGLLKKNSMKCRALYTTDVGHPIFASTMSTNRFEKKG